MSQSFTQVLPRPIAGDANTQALASFMTERFVPANTATTITLTNQIIPGFESVFKNGTRLDSGAATPAYTMSGKTITLHVAANGTDVFHIQYFFRASQ